jgi:hypothetical protein
MLGELVTTTGDLKTQLDTLAVEIKAEIKRTVESAIRIGKMLLQAKEITVDVKCGIEGANPNMRFGKWVAENFSGTFGNDRTPLNFMNVARVYGDRDPAELDKIGLSVLYELSAPKVTKNAVTVREAVEEAIKRGEKVTVQDVREWIKEATLALPKPTPAAPPPEPVEAVEIEEVDDTPPWEDSSVEEVIPEPEPALEPSPRPSFDDLTDHALDTARQKVGELINIKTTKHVNDFFIETFMGEIHPDYFVSIARAEMVNRLRTHETPRKAIEAGAAAMRQAEEDLIEKIRIALENAGNRAMTSFLTQVDDNKVLSGPNLNHKLLAMALDESANPNERITAADMLLART